MSVAREAGKGGHNRYCAAMRLSAIALFVLFGCATLSAKPRPKQGQACDSAGQCARHLECVHYRGFAGAAAPEMTSCERRCTAGKCPNGEVCLTIADGPGEVCRPPQ